jgi:hypothetical protein
VIVGARRARRWYGASMRRRTRLLCAACLALLLVGSGTAALAAAAGPHDDVDMATVSIGTLARSARTERSVRLPLRADVVGVAWDDPSAALELRTRSAAGRWSSWQDVEASDVGADPSTGEGRGALGRVVSEPVWVGGAELVEVRVRGAARARGVRVVAINVTGTATARDRATGSLARAARTLLGRDDAQAAPQAGRIHPRSEWSAAEPRSAPEYADSIRGVVIHHTDTPNGYSCAQVPALLRGIQRYHMAAQGWNDIGYNFLVDRCGGIWEGRAGGTTEPVIGAHTYGFNTRTSGIALLGTHTSVRPTARARLALRRLVAWRLDIAHVRPNAGMVLTAGSSGKFTAGRQVRVRAVSGHRDLYPTSCPGAMQYRDLDALAAQAWRTGGAKVANVTTTYGVRDGASATHQPVAWVDVRSVAPWANQYTSLRIERASTGQVLRVLGGRGLVRSTRWRVPASLDVPAWDLRVVANAALPGSPARARPATVPVQAVPDDPVLTITTPPQAAVTPNGDGVDDEVVLAYTLGLDYRLQATLVDPATGADLASLLAPRYVGPTGTPRELRLAIPAEVPAGRYVLRLSLPADPAAGRSVREFTLDVVR